MSNRFVLPIQSVFDGNGSPLSGATLDFYITGTSKIGRASCRERV